ncbi:MAG: nicotinate (nicotinamide) nucleotide adenylyltransferase [Clostridia bacterium]|nr:nicotinate (nicotinamide) nucleotide adenylyltransferase [Clostridia bacterium]
MKVAIFGGSFNPVHNEHINIVKAAIKCLSLDKVIIMPSNITPAKNGRMFANAADRLNMCKLAFADVPQTVVSDFEISNSGISYSYITCREFKESYPDSERYFIIGGDSLENFNDWKYPEEILKCVTLAVCARGDEKRLKKAEDDFYSRFGKRVKEFDYIGKNISSTRIRARAALGESLEGCVSRDVEKYITDNSIYLIECVKKIKKSLSEFRWNHTVGVAVMAAENCTRYEVSERDAVLAALLHDCGKEMPQGDALLLGCNIPSDVPPPVIHQFTSAYLAEHVYGIKDIDVLNAVKYHCSGRENMTPIEKLVYLSDMLEEGRDYDGVQKMRDIFEKDKEEALYYALERQLQRLNSSGFPVYVLTQKAYDYLKEHRNDK